MSTQTVTPRTPAPQQGRMRVVGPDVPGADVVLTDTALDLVARLHDAFHARRNELLALRQERRRRVDAGQDLDLLPETAAIRQDPTWRVAGPGPGLEDRRVEITGPPDRKMAVHALNSGARVWMADLEDATSPTWQNVVGGQVVLRDVIRGQVGFTAEDGREYRVGAETPTVVVRPRGWHLPEKHLRWVGPDGREAPAVGALVDAGLFLAHNARPLVEQGRGPYLYLPKLEGHLEARLWDDVLRLVQDELGLPHGTVRVTVLVETIQAAFEMEEILYELRDHCAGLNAGRWDYIFSIVKTFRSRGSRFVLPDRAAVTMTVPFMRAYTELLVSTCHRRGAHAIGGMSAFVPNRRDEAATARALTQVRRDKEREADDGFDGSWVAHPDLVPVAREVFDRALGDRPDQRERLREDVRVTGADLLDLRVDGAAVTLDGVRRNVSVGLRYLAAWLSGRGAVALDDLMEDAATAEISRSQLWQWVHQGVRTAEGPRVSPELVRRLVAEAAHEDPDEDPEGSEARRDPHLREAADLLAELVLGEEFPTFLTLPAYCRHLVRLRDGA